MTCTVTVNSLVTSIHTALRRITPAQRAAVVSSSAAVASRRGAALLQPSTGVLAASRTSVLRGAAVCCAASAGEDVVEVELKVDGMVCDGCSSRVAEALQKLAGVKEVHVDLEKGIAKIQVQAASQIDAFNAMPQMVETVTGLGFEAQPHFSSEEA